MQKYTFKSGFTTNFEYIKQDSSKKSPFTILYLHGLCSDPWGKKPEAVKKYAEDNGIDFLRFELAGHGSDIKSFENTDMYIWKAQVLELIDNLIETPIVLVGSSIGGWLSLLAAKERPNRTVGLVGLAAAPDFMLPMYENLFSDAQKKELEGTGKTSFGNKDFAYIFTKRLIESGIENMVLNHRELKIDCPVFLIHGTEDASIPYQHAFSIANKLTSKNVTIKIRKGSNHRLNADEDIFEILTSLDWFKKTVGK